MKQNINLFEGAKFGDWYMTSEGYKVRYVGNLGNPDIAIVIVPTTGCEKHVSVNGYLFCGSCLSEKQFVIGRCDADIDEDTPSYIKWNSMDKEPFMCGVILYSKRENKIYDGFISEMDVFMLMTLRLISQILTVGFSAIHFSRKVV